MKKLKAYTLIEMISVLVISALVISMGYWGYLSLTSMMTKYRLKQHSLSQWRMLDSQLYRHIASCDSLAWSKPELKLTHHSEKKIDFLFTTDYIVQKAAERRDTFFLKTSNPSLIPLEDGRLSFQFDLMQGDVPIKSMYQAERTDKHMMSWE